MPCSNHRRHKKGNCSSCGCCKLCLAPPSCRTPKQHHVLRSERQTKEIVRPDLPSGGTFGINVSRIVPSARRQLSSLESVVDLPARASKRSKTVSVYTEVAEEDCDMLPSNPVKKLEHGIAILKRLASGTTHADISCDDQALASESLDYLVAAHQKTKESSASQTPRNNFEKLSAILELLGWNGSSTQLLNDSRFKPLGYAANSLQVITSRTRTRARLLRTKLVDRMLCPEDPTAFTDTHTGFVSGEKSLRRREENANRHLACSLSTLSLTGSKETRVLSNALLAGSFFKDEVTEMLHSSYVSLEVAAPPGRCSRTWYSHNRARENYKVLMDKGEVKILREYAFRVNPLAVKSCVEYLQEKLHYRPGIVRNITVGDFTFRGLPVYSRGGLSLQKLFDDYKTSLNGARAGRPTFIQLAKMMTKKGKMKTGLSSYYVKLNHVLSTVKDAAERLCKMDQVKTLPGLTANTTVSQDADALIKRADELRDFLTYAYSANHLILDGGTMSCHCCRHGLNKGPTPCPHEHGNENMCKQCCGAINFSDGLLALSTHVTSSLEATTADPSAELKRDIDEIRTMCDATSLVTPVITQYMGHRVRAFAQFAEIKQVYKDLTASKGLLIIDHKQKILPLRFEEGQVEYFGKRGMSLLGAMLVRRVVRNGKVGLERIHFDMVFEGYHSQDHLQVCGALQVLLPYIKELYPELCEIIILSDNASCFASHDNVPFIRHLNQQMQKPVPLTSLQVSRWIYTEACTGKDEEDTHFSFISLLINSFVLDDNDVLTERDIFDGLCFGGGIAGSTAILIDAKGLEGSQTVLVGGKSFKGKTGVRSTHEMAFVGTGVEIKTISGITACERVSLTKLEKYPIAPIATSILKTFTSNVPPRFKPDKTDTPTNENEIAAQEAQVDDIPVPVKGTPEYAFATALGSAGIEFGGQDAHIMFETADEHCNFFDAGWACYPKRELLPVLRPDTMELLIDLHNHGSKDKAKRVSPERGQAIIFETVAKRDWGERMRLSVARTKAVLGLTKGKMQEALAKSIVAWDEANADTNQQGGLHEEAVEGASNTNTDGDEADLMAEAEQDLARRILHNDTGDHLEFPQTDN